MHLLSLTSTSTEPHAHTLHAWLFENQLQCSLRLGNLNEERCWAYISAKQDMQLCDPDTGRAFIHEASRLGFHEVVDHIITRVPGERSRMASNVHVKHSDGISQPTTSSWSPLAVAVHNAQRQVVDVLVLHGDSLAQTLGTSLHTMLMVAIESDKCDFEFVEWLLQFHSCQLDLDAGNTKGETAIMIAAKSGNLDMVRLLHRFGSDVLKQDDNGKSAVHHAILHGHEAIVDWMVAVDAVNTNVWDTPLLLFAVQVNNVAIAELVGKHASNKFEVVSSLIPIGMSPNDDLQDWLTSKTDREDRGEPVTLLAYACHHNYYEMADLLLELGADPYMGGDNSARRLCKAPRLRLLIDQYFPQDAERRKMFREGNLEFLGRSVSSITSKWLQNT